MVPGALLDASLTYHSLTHPGLAAWMAACTATGGQTQPQAP
jgi:hypothetical protein